jgi:hypothetical protein
MEITARAQKICLLSLSRTSECVQKKELKRGIAREGGRRQGRLPKGGELWFFKEPRYNDIRMQ